MSKKKNLKVALVGNPNSGKSSLFNQLTGLNQKVGNFPGVTVDKKTGTTKLNDDDIKAEIIDLPGSYSLFPRSLDEKVVFDTLVNPRSEERPDIVVVVVDAANIKRNLLLFTQVKDLGIPVVLALNMLDVATNLGQKIRPITFAKEFGVPVVSINARTGHGTQILKDQLSQPFEGTDNHPIFNCEGGTMELRDMIMAKFDIKNDYQAYLVLQQSPMLNYFSDEEKKYIFEQKRKYQFQSELLQSKETIDRYKHIDKVVKAAIEFNTATSKNLTELLDKIFTHKIFGYLIFLSILFIIFQAIFSWASVPMDIIDSAFGALGNYVKKIFPAGVLSNLLAEGIIPGIGGVVIFIPQIAILFAFISILEESGYMARVVFLMDKIMRKFGLNGRSVVPLMSGMACAIPAIMSTRTIDNWKERLITIFVTPFMSCSARLPVYTILIALVVPESRIFGILNLQGLMLMLLYFLGFLMAILSAWLMKSIIKIREKSYFMLELPLYKFPRWKNVGLTIYEKSHTFAFEAGKIILAISIVLWVLASYGPNDSFDLPESYVEWSIDNNGQKIDEKEYQNKVAAYKLEHSYAGYFGKAIEPIIKPLGYDWKIGIALITSFAAREVFVGTMATIYAIGSNPDDNMTIKNRMRSEKDPITGKPKYSFAVAFSLMLFYTFAMQCMSTLAVVYRETKSIKWPLLQLLYMSSFAYLVSFISYQILS